MIESILNKITAADRTPLVVSLLGIIDKLQTTISALEERIVLLEDEIASLKKNPKRPNIKPNKKTKKK